MNFMYYINMVPDWVACFWCLIAGWSACHAVWCIRTRHSKSERTSGRDVVVIVGRLAVPDVADPTPPVANGADKRAPSNDDGHDRGKQGGNKANVGNELHALHYTISPDEAEKLKRELLLFGNQHSYNFMTTVLTLIENARGVN